MPQALKKNPRILPIEDMREAADYVRLEFDTPPSVNALNRNSKLGRARTQAYNNWRTSAGSQIMVQRPLSIHGHFGIVMEIQRASTRADLDNLTKATLDVLKMMRVIQDDSLANVQIQFWVSTQELWKTRVTLWKIGTTSDVVQRVIKSKLEESLWLSAMSF